MRGGGARRRSGSLLVVVLVAAVVLGAGLLARDDAPAPPELPPVPERRFIRIGETKGGQFDDAQLDQLASDFDIVLFAKFHGNWRISAQHEAARELDRRRTDIEVYPYFSTKYWFDTNEWGTEPDPAWYLRGLDGEIVQKQRGGEDDDKGVYVDLANPDYRDWAIDVLRSWLEAAPYDGISFDAADPIGDHPAEAVEEWEQRLGEEHVRAYNDGLRDLLARAQALVGDGGSVVFNGFSPNPLRGPGRDLDLLEVTDGALNERFCIERDLEVVDIRTDVELLEQHRDSLLLVRTNVPEGLDGPDRERWARFCTAAFLLAWEPGQTYFQLATSYTTSQLEQRDPDALVQLGEPTAPPEWDGAVASRRFEDGAVVVNTGPDTLRVVTPQAGEVIEVGRVVDTVDAGDQLTLDPHTAVLIRSTAP